MWVSREQLSGKCEMCGNSGWELRSISYGAGRLLEVYVWPTGTKKEKYVWPTPEAACVEAQEKETQFKRFTMTLIIAFCAGVN